LTHHQLFGLAFGPYAPLAEHMFYSTLTFIFILACLYLVKRVSTALFPPIDYVATGLRIIDHYAASLGLIAFIIWTSMDIALLFLERWGRG
jgi:hypothetical protein